MFGKKLQVLAAAAALTVASQTKAITMFFSPTNTGDQSASLGLATTGAALNDGASTGNKLYLWALPNSDPGEAKFGTISVNISVSNTAGGVNITGFAVDNPTNANTNPRWATVNNGTLNPANRTSAAASNGVPLPSYIGVYKASATNGGTSAVNLGFGNATTGDPDKDSVTGAYLFGTLTYDTTAAFNANTGVTLSLQTGGADAAGPGPTDPSGGTIKTDSGVFPTLFFGGNGTTDQKGRDAAALANDRGSTSSIPDAFIGKVPEPGSLALLSLGALGLIRRRKA